MKSKLSKFLIFLILVLFTSTTTAHGLSPEQKRVLQSGSEYFNVDRTLICSAGRNEETSVAEGSKVYVLGDSITHLSRTNVESSITEAGFVISKINADSGRAITYDSGNADEPAGIPSVEADASIIKGSDAVVIALGTNSGNEDLNIQIPAIIQKVKNTGFSGSIFWVNLFYKSGNSVSERNEAIASNAISSGYSVIDTTEAGIELSEDEIHPTNEGNVVFAQVLADGLVAVVDSSVSTGVVTGDCSCGISGGGAYGPIDDSITWGSGVWADGSSVYESGLSGPYTIEQWAIHVLKNIARKSGRSESTMVTENKVVALVAWAKAEGGAVDGHNGTFNPLNTKSVYDDVGGKNEGNASTDSNSSGYTSFDFGVEAITRGLYNVYQKRIGSALLNPNFAADGLTEAKAGDFYSPDGSTVINRLENVYPGDRPFAMLSVTGYDYGGGIGDRDVYINALNGAQKSVEENYAAYAGKILDQSPSGTPTPLIYDGNLTTAESANSDCDNQGTEADFVNGFPIYKQNDPKWGGNPYGVGTNANGNSRTIASSGCGPSAMAMIITALTGETVTPADTAAFGMQPGSTTYSTGGGSDGVALATKMAEHWGLKATYLGPSETNINNTLRSGGLVIVSGRGALPFSPGGHFVVIRALTDDGKWLVGDSSHTSITPDTSTVEYDPQSMIGDFTAQGYSSYAITK